MGACGGWEGKDWEGKGLGKESKLVGSRFLLVRCLFVPTSSSLWVVLDRIGLRLLLIEHGALSVTWRCACFVCLFVCLITRSVGGFFLGRVGCMLC